MADQHLVPFMREGKGAPLPYANVIVAERFGVLPWWLDDEPADKVLYYFGVLATEASTMALFEGMSREERLIREGD